MRYLLLPPPEWAESMLIDDEGAITSMSRVGFSPVLVRDEHDRIWPFVGGEE